MSQETVYNLDKKGKKPGYEILHIFVCVCVCVFLCICLHIYVYTKHNMIAYWFLMTPITNYNKLGRLKQINFLIVWKTEVQSQSARLKSR